jgi:hypothetical protein
MTCRIALLVTAVIVASVHPALACFQMQGAPRTLVSDADVIVRVRVVSTADASGSSSIRSNGERSIRFQILEQLKGDVLFDIAVPGTLTDRSDMNDLPVPYGMVRPDGRGGGCFARTYQPGGEYLLLLRKVDGTLTPYWAPLGATNEQIRGEHDPWVDWVREQIGSGRQKAGRLVGSGATPARGAYADAKSVANRSLASTGRPSNGRYGSA